MRLPLKTRLRELAAASGRLVEFSVAWARRLKNLSPDSVRRLRDGLREQTRQTGGKLGQGADFRVYESFTPGRGRTVTKTLVPDALKERDEVVASAKKAWADVEALPAGQHAAKPLGWHESGYVQDRMVDVSGRRAGRSFFNKISQPLVKGWDSQRASDYPVLRTAQLPAGAIDSKLTARGPISKRTNREIIEAHNIMLDPRKRRLVLTDPLGWQSSSKAKGSTDGPRPWLTPGPAVR